jgi:hypothetical protein
MAEEAYRAMKRPIPVIERVAEILQDMARNREEPITYGELRDRVGRGIPQGYGAILSKLCRAEQALGRPPLSALVVAKSSGMPGAQYYQMLDEVYPSRYDTRDKHLAWQQSLEDVYAYWADR